PGSATITATSEGKSGTSAVTVSNMPVASVSVAPSAVTVDSGSTTQLTATLRDENGSVLSGRIITWGSSSSSVASVSAAGLVTGKTAGTVTITATSEGKSGTSSVTVAVVPPQVASVDVAPSNDSIIVGATTQLTATAKDASGNTLGGNTMTWTTSDASVAKVSTSGLVTGVAAGTVTMTASSHGKSGKGSVVVKVAPVASVSVTPSTASLIVGGTVSLTAATFDANGNQLTGRSVSWTTGASSIATVATSGVVTAVAVGKATIYATSEG